MCSGEWLAAAPEAEPIVGTDCCLRRASCGAGVAPSLGRFNSTFDP